MIYQERKNYLEKLKKSIKNHENDIKKALYDDLGKSKQESYMTEIGVVLSEISYMIKNLKKWMKPKRIKATLTTFPSKSYLFPEPYGKVLIMAPWNYPFQLVFAPLVGAIAAGNLVVVKPSEYAPHTEKIVKTIINEVFENNTVEVVSGDRVISNRLLDERFDYIFFTGSEKVGKIVMEKASKHLTPLTLELGGKSPAIVINQKDLRLAAKRIAFGKLINAGQTCIAPDYLLIEETLVNDFIKYFDEAVKSFYIDPIFSFDYPKIITDTHYQRLLKLMENQEIIYGGSISQNKIGPTILIPNENSEIMNEEIFGPILPMIKIKNIEEIHNYIKEKPLATYLFTDDKKIRDYIIKNVSTGGITINDTLMHFSNHHLGFGGVGKSGMGKYHGKHSFDTFTHYKPVLIKSNKFDINSRYLPSDEKKERFIKRILK
ncbi:aldehyde dehydrogenase family protein [Acholeplasma equifetale]|uniref:aldehyde dehydrogenase family protein n=1 Tax=Acholeplasma equifetale TaxID=264634 RepID=UPI00068B8876|nr:aldehyde dehydrogenase family protein [Acholeplasma equifetale]